MSATGQFTRNRDANEFRRWLDPYAFPEIAEEGEDDWPRGKGQTFPAFMDSRRPLIQSYLKNRGASRPKDQRLAPPKICIQPIGPVASHLIEALAEGVHAFYGLPCVALSPLSIDKLASKGHTTIRRRGSQVHAGNINAALRHLLPSDTIVLVGVTMHDLWKGDMNYLFGLGSYLPDGGVGVFSMCRQDNSNPDCETYHGRRGERGPEDEAAMLRRGYATLTHEIGHAFGLKHCVFFSCPMQGANSLEEAEGRNVDLCPVCLRKLLYAVGCESAEGARARYERLTRFFAKRHEDGGFDHHLSWVAARLSAVTGEASTAAPVLMCEPCEEEPAEASASAAESAVATEDDVQHAGEDEATVTVATGAHSGGE